MGLRQDIEKDIYDLMDSLDPSGKNTARMKDMLSSMKDDKAFYRWAKNFYEDDDQNFNVAYEPYNNPVNVHFIEGIAKKYNIKLYDYMYMPYLNGDTENPPGTLEPVMVLDFPIKRLKQMVFKKNHTGVSITKRNAETGQVTDADKTVRITDVEAFSLIAQGQYNASREFYSFRADDMAAKYEALRRIQQDGQVYMNDLPNDTVNKVTMNTLNAYLIGSGLSCNLIENTGLLLPITLAGKEEKQTSIQR